MEVQIDARELCRRAAGWHATFEVLRRKMSGPTNCPAHFSTANETFFGAVLCTSYFLFSCFRMHWMGKVSSCGINVTQCWILISDHISTSLKMWINGYLPKFLCLLPFISTEDSLTTNDLNILSLPLGCLSLSNPQSCKQYLFVGRDLNPHIFGYQPV